MLNHVSDWLLSASPLPHTPFTRARQDMLRALDAWLSERPCAADAGIEIEATINALRSMVAFHAEAR